MDNERQPGTHGGTRRIETGGAGSGALQTHNREDQKAVEFVRRIGITHMVEIAPGPGCTWRSGIAGSVNCWIERVGALAKRYVGTSSDLYLPTNFCKFLDLPKSRICLFERRYVVPFPILVTMIVVL